MPWPKNWAPLPTEKTSKSLVKGRKLSILPRFPVALGVVSANKLLRILKDWETKTGAKLWYGRTFHVHTDENMGRVAVERTSKPHEFWAKNQPKRSYNPSRFAGNSTERFIWMIPGISKMLLKWWCLSSWFLQLATNIFKIIFYHLDHYEPSSFNPLEASRTPVRFRPGSIAEVVHQRNLLIFPVLGSSGRLSSHLNYPVIQYAFYKEISSEIYTTKRY